MTLHPDLIQGIQEFLALAPSNALRRGRQYFANGAVLELNCVEPDHLFAAVVRGGEDYDVGLDFAHGAWAAECSCPVGEDCKHIVAALLAWQARGPDRGKIGGAAEERFRQPRGASKGGAVAQPPRSPLRDKLTAHLGRGLRAEEGRFIRLAQDLFASARTRGLMENDLCAIAGRYDAFNHWKHLEIWPEFPADDFQFWLFVARELRRRGWKFPPFMDGITDLSAIEPMLNQWEREKNIEEWKDRFRQFEGGAPTDEPAVLELRLAILPEAARLQWRLEGQADFAELKQTHAQRLSSQFQEGALRLAPGSLPLWS